MRTTLAIALTLIMLPAAFGTARADWPTTGLPLFPANTTLPAQQPASDGAGGAWVVSGYARLQHVMVDGTLAFPFGVEVSDQNLARYEQQLVGDGAGGVIVGWRNSGTYGVHLQHVDGDGNQLWGTTGLTVFLGTTAAYTMISDGAGGVIVFQVFNLDSIYAQHIDATGAALWGTGILIASTSFGTIYSTLPIQACSDGGTGYVVLWTSDEDGDANHDFTAQRIDAAGNPQWGANGLVVNQNPATRRWVTIAPDPAGGFVAVWLDYRANIFNGTSIYGQRVDLDGNFLWSASGEPLIVRAGDRHAPVVREDGTGGWVFAWRELVSPAGTYAQRIDGNATPVWAYYGVQVLTTSVNDYLDLMTDGAGGAVVTAYGVVRRIDAGGQLMWDNETTAITDVLGSSPFSVIASQPGYAMVLATGTNDPRIQRVDLEHGQVGQPEPHGVEAADNPGDQGGSVVVRWLASERDVRPGGLITEYTVWRSPAGADTWSQVASQPSLFAHAYSALAPTPSDGTPYDWKVRANTSDAQVFWESLTATAASTDDLPPAAPSALVAALSASGVTLSWSPGDTDAARYAVFRGAAAGVGSETGARIATVTDTRFVDDPPPGTEAFYAVAAIDAAGHMSAPSNEVEVAAPAGGTPALSHLALRANVPNPFRTATALRIGAPAAGEGSIEVFDVAGRRVATRRGVRLVAGWNSVRFDGRDDAGRLLPSGVYVYRVTTAAGTVTQKFLITR